MRWGCRRYGPFQGSRCVADDELNASLRHDRPPCRLSQQLLNKESSVLKHSVGRVGQISKEKSILKQVRNRVVDLRRFGAGRKTQ
jgi:fructose-1,6-bisphosphatase/inositol monophosphatase family enzyme